MESPRLPRRIRRLQRVVVASVIVLATPGVVVPAAFGAEAPSSEVAGSQSGRNLEQPPTWMARYDDGSGDRPYLVMRPGWHVNPGPAGIFWDPGSFASGDYSISSTIFLFPEGSGEPPAGVDAPYGILFAGTDLDGPAPDYVAFLLRNDGSFRVERRRGDDVDELVAWTSHEAVVTWSIGDEGTARNVLGIDVTEQEISFWANETQLAALPRAEAPSEGTVGLRVGDGLSLHITDIVIGPNLRRQ